MVMLKCLLTLRRPMSLPTARPISSAPRSGFRSRTMRFSMSFRSFSVDEQLVALAPAFLGQSVVLADDEPLAREVRTFNLGEIARLEQRQLQGAVFGGEFLDRRGSQRGDPVE